MANKTITNYRSSRTGRFVPKANVKRYPNTTETERNPRQKGVTASGRPPLQK